MNIVITTNHPFVALQLKTDVPKGVFVRVPPIAMKRDMSIMDALQIVVEVTRDINIALFTTWLIEKTNKDKNNATIEANNEKFSINEETIRRIIKEEFEKNND